jgi:hypothetical protein
MNDKDRTAYEIAKAHQEMEPSISLIIRLVAEREDDEREPLKLLEVNPATSPSGILPIAFGASPPEVPYPSVIVEVTEAEYEAIQAGTLRLPAGWQLGNTLVPVAA